MGSVSSEQGVDSRAELKKQPLDLELPVVATGARPGDKSEKRELFSEETETVLVFESGCVIQLSAAVTVGQLIFLTNKQTGKEIVTQVLRKRNYRPTSCYVELEFTEPAPGFWGTEFPDIDPSVKASLAESRDAAAVAEAELTEEDSGPAVAPPDAAEVERLRHEVEALKAQLKSLTPPPEEAKPAPAKMELMSPNEPKPEIAKPEEAKPEEVKPASGQEQNASYPIPMQLPKAQGGSNRTSGFAADDAAADHLLPKPSLDFAKYQEREEPSPKLYSRSARRGLAGPIGVLVVIVLLLTASGIMAYKMGWLSRSSKKDSGAAMFPANAGNGNGKTESTEPSNSVNTDEVSGNKSSATPTAAVDSPIQEPVENAHADGATGKSAEQPAIGRSSIEKRNAKRAPIVHESTPIATAANSEDAVVVPPKLVKSIRSLSPPEALRGYVSGNVKLDALVDETGRVTSATVISGAKALHDKAIETVKQYVYQPATKNGKPVPAHVPVTIQFWYEP